MHAACFWSHNMSTIILWKQFVTFDHSNNIDLLENALKFEKNCNFGYSPKLFLMRHTNEVVNLEKIKFLILALFYTFFFIIISTCCFVVILLRKSKIFNDFMSLQWVFAVQKLCRYNIWWIFVTWWHIVLGGWILVWRRRKNDDWWIYKQKLFVYIFSSSRKHNLIDLHS